MKTFFSMLLVCAGLGVQAAKAQFIEYPSSLPNVQHSSLAWGDYDNDDDLDIFIMGWDGNKRVAQVFKNESGQFSAIVAKFPGLNSVVANNFAWGDFDCDGDLDLMMTGQDGAERIARVYKNYGDDQFGDIRLDMIGFFGASVAWGDYDNDGDLDILLSGKNADNVRVTDIYENEGGNFQPIQASLIGVSDGSSAWGDYDNDGDLDILITGRLNKVNRRPISKVYRNDGGKFTDIQAAIKNVSRSSVAWGDYDLDSDLDILMTGLDENDKEFIAIYQNNSGSFTRIPTPLVPVSRSAVAWGDYDSDGDPDILLTGSTAGRERVSKVYQNLGRGLFADSNAQLEGVSSGSVAWGDFDKDGDLDILLCGEDKEFQLHTRIYENKLNKPAIALLAPKELEAVVSGKSVTLSWKSMGKGVQSYNVRVGESPSGSNILSSMANAETGFRKVVETGNASLNEKLTIKDLAPGTYYWSVQAINSVYLGSPFAEEMTFVIP